MNTKVRKFFSSLLFPASLLSLVGASFNSLAQEELHDGYDLQEIIVSAPFEERVAETSLPITVLSGEALLSQVNNSLGETLKNQIGINSASFGTGVGQPVVRGQSARRVMVLQNSVGVTDVAAFSPDHVNSVEAILAERVEVIRGPSTLLYGSGAIGGVVNVIDNRVPESLVEDPQFILQQTRDTVNDENKTIVRLDAAAGNFAFHLDAFRRTNDNVEINGFAIDEVSVERLEELVAEHLEEGHHDEHHHDDDHDDHDDHDGEEEVENTNGFIGNSDVESDGGTMGFSWVGDNGFIGFSVNELNNDYGLPPGAHGHHE
ncbi:MAG: Plug domain-containing protein, partial [Gammaproteobacteria bacterium]|nr:Plug domain-containing protein [Gammaproteobacteria bacterium]